MWVIFLLSSVGFAIALMLVIYLGNKMINAMKKDNSKLEQELENKENKTNEKENKEWVQKQ